MAPLPLTWLTGNYGIIGDNGQITKVEGNTIVNETNNSYYNPITNETSEITNWNYDYSTRTYICVSMSGNGCRTFETMSKLTLDLTDKQGTPSVAFPALFQLLASDADANVSHIDIACDDREGYLDMDEIIAKARDNAVNSRMRRRNIHESLDGVNKAGATLYIGARSSSFYVRIYDKALEQGEPGHWVRVELVMRSKNANAFVEQMTGSENVGKLAAQVINDKFSFIERDDSNITRCTVCSWWQNFVDELESSAWWPVKSSSTRWSRSAIGWRRREGARPGISRAHPSSPAGR